MVTIGRFIAVVSLSLIVWAVMKRSITNALVTAEQMRRLGLKIVIFRQPVSHITRRRLQCAVEKCMPGSCRTAPNLSLREPVPKESKVLAMPASDGFGFDDE
jgi:hypothetical protein